ncbi:TBC1 domain family member 25 [Halotydeus destructor]|nr:TBC1 domain family member 25 [Halotydeus destructor]
MNDLVSYHIPEAVRIEVVKVDEFYGYAGDDSSIDVRRFTVDPQVTSIGVLQSIVVKAFSLKGDFTLNYYRPDIASYVPLTNEWDLDCAFISCSRPFLQIKLKVDRRQHGLTDWDIVTVADLTKAAAQSAAHRTQNMASSFLDRVEKLASKVSLLGLSKTSKNSSFSSLPSSPESVGSSSSSSSSPSGPLTEKQYLAFLDAEGRLKGQRELRISVYRRGVEPSLRKVVWKQLLNVYPPGLSGQQRIEYMKAKGDAYFQLRSLWQTNLADPQVEHIYNMVKKDVLRTDRSHSFYSGAEPNANCTSLLNLLTTFALNHRVRYCQGMSDLASPILYAMKGDESHAYISFCGLMMRTKDNFASDGASMSAKFQHLVQLLMYYDPEFYCYLKQNNAHELLFCYRWLLLELKREFAFDDALHMMEVMWSSIPPCPMVDLALCDKDATYRPGGQLVSSVRLSDSGMMATKTLISSPLAGSVVKHSGSYDRETLKGSLGITVRSSDSSVLSSNGSIRSKPRSESLERTKMADDDYHCSSGRGSISAYSSITSASAAIDVPKVQRPLRKIRFLPKILSTDSREIESPEEEEFRSKLMHYSLPPKFIDKQFSIDYEDSEKKGNHGMSTRLVGSFEEGRRARLASAGSVGSFDRDPNGDRSRVRSFECQERRLSRNGSLGSLSPKRRFRMAQSHLAESRLSQNRAKFLRQRNASEDSTCSSIAMSFDAGSVDEEYMVHCNGEQETKSVYKDWPIPRGLARSVSFDSLRGSDSPRVSRQNTKDDAPFWDYCGEHDFYKSNVFGNSNSSSCNSLVILSASGNVVGTCSSQKYKVSLPSPEELGSHSAFMLFLSLTMLLQHRDTIMTRGFDGNEMAMYLDSLVRKHKVKSVLDSGRHLFHSYLSQWQRNTIDQGAEGEPAKRFYVNGAAYLSSQYHDQRCGL